MMGRKVVFYNCLDRFEVDDEGNLCVHLPHPPTGNDVVLVRAGEIKEFRDWLDNQIAGLESARDER